MNSLDISLTDGLTRDALSSRRPAAGGQFVTRTTAVTNLRPILSYVANTGLTALSDVGWPSCGSLQRDLEEGMLFTRASVLNFDATSERASFGRARSTVLSEAYVARAFYCDALQGQQVWEEFPEGEASLSFIVEGTRIDVNRNAADDGEPIAISVSDPRAVAERCWDAGYTIRVESDDRPRADGEPVVSVIDPFGRQIDLVRCISPTEALEVE